MTFVHVHGAPKFGCLNIQYYNNNNRLMALYQGQLGSGGTRTLRNINHTTCPQILYKHFIVKMSLSSRTVSEILSVRMLSP